MVSGTRLLQTLLATTGVSALAMPHGHRDVVVRQEHFEVLNMRASAVVNPAAISDARCLDRNANIVFHDQNVAELKICGGIAGNIEKCGGNLPSTVGAEGTAKFTLAPVDQGATINISKGRWEGCVRAARAVCPTGSLSATCIGGATSGDIKFTLLKWDGTRDRYLGDL